MFLRQLRRGNHALHRYFELREHHIASGNGFLMRQHVFRRQGEIGARHGNNRIFTARNGDVGDTSRVSLHRFDTIAAYALTVEVGQHFIAETVVAHRADHAHVRTQARGGHRLIGPLAAHEAVEIRSQQRFAHTRETRCVGYQIHIDTADYGHSYLFEHNKSLI